MSLTGRILPIGGVKEKALAARRSHIRHILFPEGNRKDWDELSGKPAPRCDHTMAAATAAAPRRDRHLLSA